MVIKNITIQNEGEIVRISAQCKIRKIGWDVIYFTVNKKYKDFIYPDASAFAAALVLPCMKQGEDLIIKGSLSKKLYDGMLQMMDEILTWNFGLKRINIKVDKLTKDRQQPKHIGMFFSGGVDSFYTYIKHKANKDSAVSHFILVNGYDIDLRNKDLWQKTLNHVRKIAAEEHVELIDVESNLHRLIEPILVWNYACIGGLAAVGLLLRNRLKKVYRASAYTAEKITGSLDMVIDHYLCTEKLSLIFDGSEASRVEKVKKIAHSQIVLDTLRVCYLNKKNVYNCGICDKCLRTMTELVIAGKLHQAKTFPNQINIERVRKLPIESEYGAIFHRENLVALKELNIEPELQQALTLSLNNFSKEASIPFRQRIIDTMIYLDHIYNKGKLFTTISDGKNKF